DSAPATNSPICVKKSAVLHDSLRDAVSVGSDGGGVILSSIRCAASCEVALLLSGPQGGRQHLARQMLCIPVPPRPRRKSVPRMHGCRPERIPPHRLDRKGFHFPSSISAGQDRARTDYRCRRNSCQES